MGYILVSILKWHQFNVCDKILEIKLCNVENSACTTEDCDSNIAQRSNYTPLREIHQSYCRKKDVSEKVGATG